MPKKYFYVFKTENIAQNIVISCYTLPDHLQERSLEGVQNHQTKVPELCCKHYQK